MTDMTREEAKEILVRHNEWRRGGEGGMESPKAIGEAIDVAIEALGSPWIPVTERLPDDGSIVMVTWNTLVFNVEKITIAAYRHGVWEDKCFRRIYPTHWMPIPKIKED